MACASAGDYAQAVENYQKLLEINPKYVAAYYHGGQSLEKLGRLGEARELYRRGIDISTQIGDLHTRSELEAVLDLLA
jgi:tetratricopeptide (TPR) repeat protein